jgi:predicted metalloprotease
MPKRRDTKRHIGPWLADDVATTFGLSGPVARAIVAHVLGHVVQDVQHLAEALDRGDPDLGMAARTLAVRLGYGSDRIVGAKKSAPACPRSAH